MEELVDAKIKRDKNLTEVDMSAATDEFKCYKCQKRVCSYYQLQTEVLMAYDNIYYMFKLWK